jgi:hypothetical protein
LTEHILALQAGHVDSEGEHEQQMVAMVEEYAATLVDPSSHARSSEQHIVVRSL